MEFNENTRLKDILARYPNLPDKLMELDPRASLIKTPVGKMLLAKATVKDVGQRLGVPVPELLEELEKVLKTL